MDNPFDKIHSKAVDDVKNYELREALFEARTVILSLCDLVNEWIKLSEKYKDNFELQAKIIEAKTMIRENIRKQEHLLEGYIDMNDVVSSRMVNETIDQVMEATQEWRT